VESSNVNDIRPDGLNIKYVSMSDELDWVMRPVVQGMCKYESLKDGTLRLYDISIMNEALDVEFKNKSLILNEQKRQSEGLNRGR
jgi:hypothetical protein